MRRFTRLGEAKDWQAAVALERSVPLAVGKPVAKAEGAEIEEAAERVIASTHMPC